MNIADIGHGSFYVSATSDQVYSFKTSWRSCSFFEDQIAWRGGNSDGLNILSNLNFNTKWEFEVWRLRQYWDPKTN